MAVPKSCLQPFLLRPFGRAAVGVYATYSGSWDAGVRIEVAPGCQSERICGFGNSELEAGFEVGVEVCWKSEGGFYGTVQGSATANIGVNFECCSGAWGSFAVNVNPLKQAWEIRAGPVGWEWSVVEGECNELGEGPHGNTISAVLYCEVGVSFVLMKSAFRKRLLVAGILITLIIRSVVGVDAKQVLIYATPGTPNSSFLLQAEGFVLGEFQPIPRRFGEPLDRADLTNVLSTYFAAQTPTNYHLYVSLFESGSRPATEPEAPFGPMPDAMWLKGVYRYGKYVLADIRLRCVVDGKERHYDLLLKMVRSNGVYYLTKQLDKDAGICFWETVRNHQNVWGSAKLAPTNWNGAGYFAVTNFVSETDWSNPLVFWIPGNRLGNLIVTSNWPAEPKGLTQPEDVAVAALQALITNNQEAYLALVHPDDIDRRSPWYRVTPAEYIKKEWERHRERAAAGAILCEVVKLGEAAYVTFRIVSDPCEKDWFYLRRHNDQWRLSSREVEDGNSPVIHFLRGTCVQRQPAGPSKVLPLP